jgi:hypothetical protein
MHLGIEVAPSLAAIDSLEVRSAFRTARVDDRRIDGYFAEVVAITRASARLATSELL